MASSRLQRIGSIYQRLTGIIKAGAMKEQDIPLWYEIYRAFPPKYEPTFGRPPVEKEIKPIYYPEDIIRGKFLKLYGSADVQNLLSPTKQSIMQRFVEIYSDLEKNGNFFSEEELVEATESVLEKEGISFIRNRKVPEVKGSFTNNFTNEEKVT